MHAGRHTRNTSTHYNTRARAHTTQTTHTHTTHTYSPYCSPASATPACHSLRHHDKRARTQNYTHIHTNVEPRPAAERQEKRRHRHEEHRHLRPVARTPPPPPQRPVQQQYQQRRFPLAPQESLREKIRAQNDRSRSRRPSENKRYTHRTRRQIRPARHTSQRQAASHPLHLHTPFPTCDPASLCSDCACTRMPPSGTTPTQTSGLTH
jgi:hypothetical protein